MFAPTGLLDGPHTVVASETDVAHLTGSASLSFTLDTTKPAVTEGLANDTGIAGDLITSDDTLSGSGDANAVVQLTVDGVAATTVADPFGNWTFAPSRAGRWPAHGNGQRDGRGRQYRFGIPRLHTRHHGAGHVGEPGA